MFFFTLQKLFIFEMALLRLRFLRFGGHSTRLLSTTFSEEYTAVPQYPEILELSYSKNQERKKEAWCESVKAVKTVEEKQIKLNIPRYYGFKCYMQLEDIIPYDNLELTQYLTKTHLITGSDLPEYYNNINIDSIVNAVKSDIEEAILLEHDGYM